MSSTTTGKQAGNSLSLKPFGIISIRERTLEVFSCWMAKSSLAIARTPSFVRKFKVESLGGDADDGDADNGEDDDGEDDDGNDGDDGDDGEDDGYSEDKLYVL